MKIIGGRFKGRKLKTPANDAVRPTLAKIREAFFDIIGQYIQGSCFLDLYAGTGAIGIEALSRGAGMVYFVESSRDASTLLLKNLALIKDNLLDNNLYRVIRMDVNRAIEKIKEANARVDIAYIDPPYENTEAYEDILPLLVESRIMNTMFIVGVEHDRSMKDVMGKIVSGFHFKTYGYGDTCLTVVRRN